MTTRGGKRDGSGRPRGATNKLSKAAVARAIASGEMPLDYMLKVMRDPKADVARRDEMAKSAAPYVHHKLSSLEKAPPKEPEASVETEDNIHRLPDFAALMRKN
jgi:hypothetical protein